MMSTAVYGVPDDSPNTEMYWVKSDEQGLWGSQRYKAGRLATQPSKA